MLLYEYTNQEPESDEELRDRVSFLNWFKQSRHLIMGPNETSYRDCVHAICDLAWQMLQLQVCFEGILEDLDGEQEWINKSEVSKKQSKKIPPEKKKSLRNSKKPIRSETKSATTAKK